MSIIFQRASGSIGNSHTIDIGSSGNNRLVIALASHESEPGETFQGIMTVDGKSFTQAVVADNPDGLGNHLELHTIDEGSLGSSQGLLTVNYSGGNNTNWTVHVLVYYGVQNDTLVDSGKDDVTIGYPISVTNISSNDGSLIVMATSNGTGENPPTYIWTTPLVERVTEPTPSTFRFGVSSGIESTGQTNKTYTVDSDAGLRTTAIVAVFDKADLTNKPIVNGISGGKVNSIPNSNISKINGI